jgi:cytochrome c-type biogenesis protein CcmH/NrfG
MEQDDMIKGVGVSTLSTWHEGLDVAILKLKEFARGEERQRSMSRAKHYLAVYDSATEAQDADGTEGSVRSSQEYGSRMTRVTFEC